MENSGAQEKAKLGRWTGLLHKPVWVPEESGDRAWIDNVLLLGKKQMSFWDMPASAVNNCSTLHCFEEPWGAALFPDLGTRLCRGFGQKGAYREEEQEELRGTEMHYLWGKDEGVICLGWKKKGSAIINSQNNIKWGNSWGFWHGAATLVICERHQAQKWGTGPKCWGTNRLPGPGRYTGACWPPRALLCSPTLFLTKIQTHQSYHLLWNPALSWYLWWKEQRGLSPLLYISMYDFVLGCSIR